MYSNAPKSCFWSDFFDRWKLTYFRAARNELKPLHQLPSDFIVVELGLKKEDKQKTNTNKKIKTKVKQRQTKNKYKQRNKDKDKRKKYLPN